jgi:hypothetical protein
MPRLLPSRSIYERRPVEIAGRQARRRSVQKCATSGHSWASPNDVEHRGRTSTAISGDLMVTPSPIALLMNDSTVHGPELILALLIAFVLLERGGTAVLYGPDMDLRRRPTSSGAACAFRTQHNDPVAVS